MNLARGIFVCTLQLKCCFISPFISSPILWDDLQKGITSSLADTWESHNTAKRHARPSMPLSDSSDSMRLKRPRNHGHNEVDLTSDVATLGPDAYMSKSRSMESNDSWTSLQAGIGINKDTDSNSGEKFTDGRAAPEAQESGTSFDLPEVEIRIADFHNAASLNAPKKSSANSVPAVNQLNEDHILDHQKSLPQWSDELTALKEFLGLSPDNREPAQNTHAEDRNRPQNQFVSHDIDSIHVPCTPRRNHPMIDRTTEDEHDESLLTYSPRAQSFQEPYEAFKPSPLALGKNDNQYTYVLQSLHGSDPNHIQRSYSFPPGQSEFHDNEIPILSGKKYLLDLEPPKEKPSGLCHAPLASVGRQLLHSYAKPYKEAIDKLFPATEKLSFTSQRILFRGIFVTEAIYSKDGRHRIRMIRVAKANEALQSPSRIIELIRFLLTWLIFNHDAFLVSLKPPTDIGLNSHKEMSDWLLTEFFNPRDSLPVIGKVEKYDFAHDESAFGPAQRWIIGYLSSDTGGLAAYITSAALIGLWYKNFHMGLWKSRFKNDDEFWSFLISEIELARKNDMKYHEPDYTMFPFERQHIGDFQIYDLQFLSPEISAHLRKAALPRTRMKNMETLEKDLVNQLAQSHRVTKVFQHVKKTWIKDLSMVLVETKSRYEDETNYFLRLIDDLDFVIIHQKLKVRLVCLLKKLNHYHAAFLQISFQDQQEVHSFLHMELLHWIKRVMFHPEHGLPIFGKVGKGTLAQSEIFTGEVQTYLIGFFTKSASQFEWNQTALSILGYWYKKECGDIWKTYMKNDCGYWAMMSETLSWGFGT